MKLRNYLSILSILLLTACGTARTMVSDPVEAHEAVTGITIKHHKKDTAGITDTNRNYFEKELRNALFQGTKFKENGNLTLSYRFIQFSEGSRFARWFTGGIGNAGEGSLVVEVEYWMHGKRIGKVQTDGRIGSGFFGGSVDSAIEKAAEEIARYTLAQFNAK